jgi:hypothetical protein
MRTAHLLFAAVLAFATVPALAQRLPVPIVNHEAVVLKRADGQPASAEEIRKAIMAGAQSTGRKWGVVEVAPGQLRATYPVRTHSVTTDIRYGNGQLSLKYADSINMKYAPGGPTGTGVIHPFYNQWVQEFLQAVQAELAKG